MVDDAVVFMSDLASRLSNRVQLTTDGHRPYLHAVESAFGAGIDYAMLHKIYAAPSGAGDERRYSRPSAPASTSAPSPATPTRRASPPSTWSGRT